MVQRVGWTVGIYPVRVVPVGNVPNSPSYPVVFWDEIDSWDLPSESGTCWERT